jgi:predicted transcriptional regulator
MKQLDFKYWKVLDFMNLEEWYAPYEIAGRMMLSVSYVKRLLHDLYEAGILDRKKLNFGRAAYYYMFPQFCLKYWADSPFREMR